MNIKIKKHISILIICIIGYLTLDYLNIPTLLNLRIYNINNDFLSIFINSIIVIFLYIITYLTIDKKSIEKSKNIEDIYKQILINMYNDCIETINLCCDDYILKKIVEKVDGNTPMIENKLVNNLIKTPFESKQIILDFAKNGDISVNTLQNFLVIETDYRKYINMLILCYDRKDYIEPLKIDLLKKINTEVGVLKKQL
ncbi:MAG: hypothetical protein IJH76_06485 [Clostridia bacterium]|nr:hypothetical protein [Clostridia bacterium]